MHLTTMSDDEFDKSHVRYDKLYLRAPKSWQVASLICITEPKKQKEYGNEKLKAETEMSRRNGPVKKSMQSVLRPEMRV